MPKLLTIIATSFLAFLLVGCFSAPRPAVPAAPVFAPTPELEERAVLLLLSDRKVYEPVAITQAFEGSPELRREAAFTLARIGDPRGAGPLEILLGDKNPKVRRAATFALGELGQLGNRRGVRALFGALLDEDRQTGRLAVEALAKSGVPLEQVIERLIQVPSEELLPRLLPALFRFQSESVVRWAEQGLELEDPKLRAMAAYALGRDALPAAADLLRSLLMDDDPWIRGWAARGLGQVGGREDLEKLVPLLDDTQAGPVIQALRAAGRLVSQGVAAAPKSWLPWLLKSLQDPRVGVRLTSLEVAGAWLLDDGLSRALVALAESGQQRERQLALLALAEGEDTRGAVLVVRLADDPDPVVRATVAEAAALYRAEEILVRLMEDASPRVRRAAFDVRLASEPAESVEVLEILRKVLRDPDPGVRAVALEWLAESPRLRLEELLQVLARARRDSLVTVRLAAIRAIAARADEPLERGAVIAALEELAEDPDFLLRRAAIGALVELERTPPALGSIESRKPIQVYREVVQRTRKPRVVEVFTARGVIRLQITCAEAPLTCLNFMQLVGQGFYDDLLFHRVVPDFVVQAGDPRGDGLGGAGYTIRDEVGLLRYDEGVIGMALSGPDTGGSQFFITMTPQPHLDGAYTAFGKVVQGLDVLERIVQGDRIFKILEVTEPTGASR